MENIHNIHSKEINLDTTKMINGVLCVSSRCIMGITKKNVPMKKFIPFDKKYPTFIVPTKKKVQPYDIYVTIKFVKYLNKRPVGQIIRIIGDVGNYNTEIEYIRYVFGLRWKNVRELKDETEDLTPSGPWGDNRIKINETIISIDPDSCKDIDDALHYHDYDDYIEIGVHIADVSSYVLANSQLDNIISKKCESLYLADKQFNMFPTNLCFDKYSLLQNMDKRAFSVIFNINKKTHNIDVKFVKSIINVKKNFSYDNANKLIKKNTKMGRYLKNLFDFGKVLTKYYGTHFNIDTYDVHKMIEVYMIMCNVHVAKYLLEKDPQNIITRIHKGNVYRNKTYLSNIVNVYNMSSATYEIGNRDTSHSGLNQKYYTHFTSPIRRYIDIIIHRLLYNTLVKKKGNVCGTNLKELCELSNKIHRKCKKAERYAINLKLAYELYNNNITNIEEIGYIVNINGRKLIIHIPSRKLDLECDPFPNVQDVIIDSDKDKLNVKFDNEEMTLYLYQKIKIQIVVTIKSSNLNKKLQIIIIEPFLITNLFISKD